MFITILSFFLFLFIPLTTFADVFILQEGSHWKDDVDFAKDGEEWYSIEKNDIIKAKISVTYTEPTVDPEYPENPNNTMATAHIKSSRPHSIFLIKGMNLKEGRYSFSYSGGLHPGQQVSLFSPFFMSAIGNAVYQHNNMVIENYELLLVTPEEKISVVKSTFPIMYPYGITWVGDLNGDKLPEFLLQLDTSEKGSSYQILYTTEVQNGKTIIRKLADWGQSGC
jgi:hypothetical protein